MLIFIGLRALASTGKKTIVRGHTTPWLIVLYGQISRVSHIKSIKHSPKSLF